MRMNANYFLTAQEGKGSLPDLRYDLLLADGPYPFLFTCVNEDESETYLAVCYHSDGERAEYLLSRRSPVQIRCLLKNDITIREALVGEHRTLYQVIFRAGEETPTVEERPLAALPDEILPTEGCFMDAEEGEFTEELAILEKRVEDNALRQRQRSSAWSMIQVQTDSIEIEIGRWPASGKVAYQKKGQKTWNRKLSYA